MFVDGAFTLRRFAGPLFFAVALSYLSFHALSGDRGLYALVKETHKLDAVTKELADARAKRTELERKVVHMRSDSLDLDLLDEQSRRILGESGKDEMVIIGDDKLPH